MLHLLHAAPAICYVLPTTTHSHAYSALPSYPSFSAISMISSRTTGSEKFSQHLRATEDTSSSREPVSLQMGK